MEPDTDIPIVLCYNLTHYESLHPLETSDEIVTKDLVMQYVEGRYQFGRKDLAFLLESDSNDSNVSDVDSDEIKSDGDGVHIEEDKGFNLGRLNDNLPDPITRPPP